MLRQQHSGDFDRKKDIAYIGSYSSDQVTGIYECLQNVGQVLMDNKMVAMLIMKCCEGICARSKVGNRPLSSRIIYQILVDDKLNFKQCLQYTCAEAFSVAIVLARMISNIRS